MSTIPNTNPLTGIPYGVIYLNKLDQDVAHELMYGMQATDHAYQNCLQEHYSELLRDADGNEDLIPEDWEDHFSDHYDASYVSVSGVYQGVSYGITDYGGAPMLTVYESPKITSIAAQCNQCIPFAGDLSNHGNYTCYDVLPEWFPEAPGVNFAISQARQSVTVEVSHSLPSVDIKLLTWTPEDGTDKSVFMQGDEASQFIQYAEEAEERFNLSTEDSYLYVAYEYVGLLHQKGAENG